MDDRLTGGWLAETMTTPGRLADGRPIHYAWGVSVRTHRGQPIVSHGGSFPGWESKLVVFPVQRATFICLANSQELDVSSITFNLADHILADSLDPNAPHADQTLHGGLTGSGVASFGTLAPHGPRRHLPARARPVRRCSACRGHEGMVLWARDHRLAKAASAAAHPEVAEER